MPQHTTQKQGGVKGGRRRIISMLSVLIYSLMAHLHWNQVSHKEQNTQKLGK